MKDSIHLFQFREPEEPTIKGADRELRKELDALFYGPRCPICGSIEQSQDIKICKRHQIELNNYENN